MSKSIIVQTDPTKRFQKFEEYTHARTDIIRFKAYDTLAGIEVTWHELDTHTLSEEQKEKLVEYGNILVGLKHESMLSFLHYWLDVEKHIFVFITESMFGTSVLDHIVIGNSVVSERVLAKWFHSILFAVNFLHTNPAHIIHCGINLESIFVKPSSGHAKIIPPLIDPYFLFPGKNSIKLRLSTAPEMLDHKISPASDIWSFGIALLYAVTIIEPYSECTCPNDLITKLQNCQLPDCLLQVKSPQLLDLINRCLKPESERLTADALLKHPFFKREFEPIPEPTNGDDALEVIFTGKSSLPHK